MDRIDKVAKTEAQWRAELGPERYRVCRQGGTEPPFSGAYCHTKAPGTYRCAACGQPLFAAETKYDSGSGWPSFFTAIGDDRVVERVDRSHGMVRTEVLCSRCDSHLGHVFPDGPPPTGRRFCINSLALALQPEEE
nr:peptide-methionine (R)-S-oxide reductase MsrB [Rhodothalassium salexigens]